MKGHYITFIVRIWDNEGAHRFRGSVEFAKTQERKYFDDLKEMNGFILEHIECSKIDFKKLPGPSGI